MEPGLPDAFCDALSKCSSQGYRAVNVTHPFKERAEEIVHPTSEKIRRLGAVNTVRFDPTAGPQGFNSDCTGFKRAFGARFPREAPGAVAIIGAGGIGRAIAFGLADLDADDIPLFDQERLKSESLAAALRPQSEARILKCRA